MSQPDACPNEVYQILVQCWAKMPTDRPTFEALKDFLVETAPPVLKAVQSFSEENKLVNIKFLTKHTSFLVLNRNRLQWGSEY